MVKKSEIQKKNLISTIDDCLKEHQLTVADSKHTEEMYLIQMTAPSTLLVDFTTTYRDSMIKQFGPSETILKVLSTVVVGALKKNGTQTYGVLVDKNLKCRYAFNMEFGDFNKDENRVSFKPLEDVLMKCAEQVANKINEPEVVRESSYSDMVFRYSLIGGNGGPMLKYGLPEPRGESDSDLIKKLISGSKKGESVINYLETPKTPGKVEFENNSLLHIIRGNFELSNNVEVIINEQPQKFYLVDTKYQTIPYIDLEKMYGKQNVSKNTEELSKKFGEKKENTYSVLITPDMQMKFAFNRKFSHLDKDTKQIVYPTLGEIVDGRYGMSILAELNAALSKRERDAMPRDSHSYPGSMMVKYSLCEPKH